MSLKFRLVGGCLRVLADALAQFVVVPGHCGFVGQEFLHPFDPVWQAQIPFYTHEADG